jgi:calcium-dependent protein kinase
MGIITSCTTLTPHNLLKKPGTGGEFSKSNASNHSQSAGAHLLHQLSSQKKTNLHEALTTMEGDISDFAQQYRIGGSLGEGITGEVHKVISLKTNKEFAMKSLNTHVVNDRQLRELKVEIEVLRHLDHPNVVRLVQTFSSKSEIILIMEECTGGDLRQLLSPHTTPPHRRGEQCIRHVMCQIVQAIAYCHYHGIVHRDLKLENVLFATQDDNLIKIVDFGFAALATCTSVDTGSAKRRLMQTTCGSTYYLAPEMLVDGAMYSEKVDIWSIGVMAYKILMKHRPYDGSTEDQVIRSIKRNKIDFDVVGWKRHSPAAKAFVKQCLTTDPEERPSAIDLLETADWLRQEEQLVRSQIDEDFGKQVVESMVRFQSYPKLKQVALMVVANHWAAEAGRHDDVKDFLDFFVSMDEDHSGELSVDELEHVVKRWPTPHIDTPDVGRLFNHIDQDHSGKICFSEWLASVIEARNIDAQSVDAVFDHLDSLHDGDLSISDLRSYLQDFTEDEIKTMIEQVPSHRKENGDLVVSRVEFLDMMGDKARPMLRSPKVSVGSRSPQSSSSAASNNNGINNRSILAPLAILPPTTTTTTTTSTSIPSPTTTTMMNPGIAKFDLTTARDELDSPSPPPPTTGTTAATSSPFFASPLMTKVGSTTDLQDIVPVSSTSSSPVISKHQQQQNDRDIYLIDDTKELNHPIPQQEIMDEKNIGDVQKIVEINPSSIPLAIVHPPPVGGETGDYRYVDSDGDTNTSTLAQDLMVSPTPLSIASTTPELILPSIQQQQQQQQSVSVVTSQQ